MPKETSFKRSNLALIKEELLIIVCVGKLKQYHVFGGSIAGVGEGKSPFPTSSCSTLDEQVASSCRNTVALFCPVGFRILHFLWLAFSSPTLIKASGAEASRVLRRTRE